MINRVLTNNVYKRPKRSGCRSQRPRTERARRRQQKCAIGRAQEGRSAAAADQEAEYIGNTQRIAPSTDLLSLETVRSAAQPAAQPL